VANFTAPELANFAIWSAWGVSWLVAALWRDREVKKPAGRKQIVYRLLAMAGFFLLFENDPRISVPLWRTPIAIQWACIPVVIAGFALTWWARIHLGRLWSSNVSRKADHHLVDTGPYRIVRHPIYTGLLISSTAMAAMRGTLAGWVGMVAMTLGWYVKARIEERFLREQLGAEIYDAYARRVPMLLPL